MINIENEVYSTVSEKVRAKVSDIYMSGEYVKSPPSFPAVSLVEMSNNVYRNTQTSEGNENHASIMYEVNVYSNKTYGKKTECKTIMSIIDEEMTNLGFSRTMMQPIPNMDDATIYRITARYTAVVSKNNIIYRG